jgi:hypothetical protein
MKGSQDRPFPHGSKKLKTRGIAGKLAIRHEHDEIVVDDEDFVAPAERKQCIELCHHLAGVLGSRLSTIDGDDIAEFALERIHGVVEIVFSRALDSARRDSGD